MRYRSFILGGMPITIPDVLIIFTALLLLGGCAPIATNIVNNTLGDQAELLFVLDDSTPCGPVEGNGLCFVPGDSPALTVNVNVIADTINEIDESCTPSDHGSNCDLGTVESPAFIFVSADGVTATALYRRAGSSRVYQEFAH